MFCVKCGNRIEAGWNVCPNCGARCTENRDAPISYQSGNGNSGYRGLAIASLVSGIIGLIFCCIGIGIIPSIIGLILSILSLRKQNTNNSMAVAGLITSLIGIISILILLLIAYGQE